MKLILFLFFVMFGGGRPPHGGRGLKCQSKSEDWQRGIVGPHTGAVD